jgi:hypothetical protein
LKVHIPKTVRNILFTVLIMISVFLVAGVGYVLIADRSTAKPQTKFSIPRSASEPNILKPVAPAANAQEGVAIETFVSPVKAGDNSSISVRTNAGSTCTILVTYNGVASKDSGLGPKTADAYGFATWAWTVDSTAPAGTWPVKVTCVYHDKTGVAIGNLQVTK